MNTTKRNFFIFLFIMLASASFAQDAITKAITSANSHLLVKEYEKAYSYASFVIRYYTGKEMTPDATDMCERVVAAYSADLLQADKIDSLLTMETTLAPAPASVRSKAAVNISKAKQILEQRKEEERKAAEEQKLIEAEKKRLGEIENALQLEKQKEAEREALREQERLEFAKKEAQLKAEREQMAAKQQAQIDTIIQENRLLEEKKERARTEERLASENLQVELEKQRLDAEIKSREEFARLMEISNQSGAQAFQTVSKTSTMVVIGLGILGLIVLVGISLIVIMNLKQQAIQHEQFQSTIKTMNNLRTAQPDLSAVALPFFAQAMQALPNNSAQHNNIQMIENKTGESNTPGSMNSPEELKALLEKCQSYSEQIDQITNRKNASKRVAELVYKISKEMGYAEHDSLLYYTVGLIYDIGFLNIDPAILRSEHISEEQFDIIKTHTSIGMNMVFFIDEKNRGLFKDGVSKHHENLDGTGYPLGLKAPDIPFIARILRVAETYTALISNREYRSITDRDSAIKELMNNQNQYDIEIVKILDGIV